jgi:Flp pilus assembly protein TadB
VCHHAWLIQVSLKKKKKERKKRKERKRKEKKRKEKKRKEKKRKEKKRREKSKKRRWRCGPAVRSTGCSSRGSGLLALRWQLTLSITPVLGVIQHPFLTLTHLWYTYIHTDKTATCVK